MWKKFKRQADFLPLWMRLLMVVMLVSSAATFTTAIAVQRSVQSATYDSVDAELHRELDNWSENLRTRNYLGPAAGLMLRANTYYAWIDRNTGDRTLFNSMQGVATPDIDDSSLKPGEFFNADSTSSSREDVTWRVASHEVDGQLVVVAKNISPEAAILKRLALGQLSLGIGVLLLVTLLGSFVVRRTLRPLRVVEETANAIAHGELDRRVPDWPTSTEIGSLGHSVNAMLEQIQSSFNKMTEKEEEMRRFVGDASHELRTPLTTVKGFAELYKVGATDDASMVIGKIESEAQRMSVLVEDLLSLTRAEGARYEKAPVDLLELSAKVASNMKAAYPGREIDIMPETINLPVVEGDSPRLTQVLTNLVANALTHGGEDAKVTIRLTEDTVDLKPTFFHIEVRDDGAGMSKEDASRIFERFYRADSSRTRSTGGSGLGLAIVKSLVEAHDGTIVVDSTLGEGTTFTVTLPAMPQ